MPLAPIKLTCSLKPPSGIWFSTSVRTDGCHQAETRRVETGDCPPASGTRPVQGSIHRRILSTSTRSRLRETLVPHRCPRVPSHAGRIFESQTEIQYRELGKIGRGLTVSSDFVVVEIELQLLTDTAVLTVGHRGRHAESDLGFVPGLTVILSTQQSETPVA